MWGPQFLPLALCWRTKQIGSWWGWQKPASVCSKSRRQEPVQTQSRRSARAWASVKLILERAILLGVQAGDGSILISPTFQSSIVPIIHCITLYTCKNYWKYFGKNQEQELFRAGSSQNQNVPFSPIIGWNFFSLSLESRGKACKVLISKSSSLIKWTSVFALFGHGSIIVLQGDRVETKGRAIWLDCQIWKEGWNNVHCMLDIQIASNTAPCRRFESKSPNIDYMKALFVLRAKADR